MFHPKRAGNSEEIMRRGPVGKEAIFVYVELFLPQGETGRVPQQPGSDNEEDSAKVMLAQDGRQRALPTITPPQGLCGKQKRQGRTKAQQSATCLSMENLQDCGDETPCGEEEPDQPGCPEEKSREGHLSSPWLLSLNSTCLGDPLPPEPGIQNPTVCLQTNHTLAFLVTCEHSPEYDLGHFYNTLEEFDWGRFRALAEESQRQDQSPYLFLQQFQQPGVFVFRLSSNRHQKMESPPAGRCPGPPVPGCAAGGPPPEGVLGTGTEAELLRPAASAGPQGGADDITVNPVTKLMVPGPNCMMLPASGHTGSVPTGYFIHPDTGRVLPEAGNLGYDLHEATLVPTTDSSSGGVRTSEAAILPYVPYPTCPATGSPPATRLPVLQPRRTSQLGALMTDPITGIEVPVLAVTLHPQTRQWLTLGGAYCNPLTKTLVPLELGGPMEDPVTGGISPILGVGLDEKTGLLEALSALLPPSPPCLAWLLNPLLSAP
ncbi:hypothetical protein HPG69_018550 [Diceros bicornis minor]|uniref:Uncharacterized protein n=1 Tax=Diceros bicornis minor TaxID=77932 RepID=A0A7J7EZB5_DICBM|nr:hypothetical protein HPG69_018550 [Diceros bicornis minor]